MELNNKDLEKQKKQVIENFLLCLQKLNELEIFNSRRDFTSQIGEWLIAKMYGAELAESGKQKDWDMKVGQTKIQVKTHSKAKTTKRANTDFKYDENADINIFIIVVFTDEYKIKTIYELPWEVALKLKTTHTKDPVITWSQIPKQYIVDLNQKTRDNDLLRSFLATKN
jgi:uncharacterized protein YabE (DUF348 family)